MSDHNIGYYEEISQLTLQLSSNTHLMCFSGIFLVLSHCCNVLSHCLNVLSHCLPREDSDQPAMGKCLHKENFIFRVGYINPLVPAPVHSI